LYSGSDYLKYPAKKIAKSRKKYPDFIFFKSDPCSWNRSGVWRELAEDAVFKPARLLGVKVTVRRNASNTASHYSNLRRAVPLRQVGGACPVLRRELCGKVR